MTNTPLEQLTGEAPEATEAVTPEAPAVAETAEATPTQEAAPETPEAVETPAAEKPETPQTVPLPALIEAREKAAALRAENEALRRQQQAAQPKPEPEAMPDPVTDPEAFAAYQDRRYQAALENQRLNMSESLAREQHGDAVVDEAFKALQGAGEADKASVLRSGSPWHAVVKWHQQQKAAAEIGDPATLKERLRAEILAELQAEQAAKTPAAAPPPSLAHQSSATVPSGGFTGPTPLEAIIGR